VSEGSTSQRKVTSLTKHRGHADCITVILLVAATCSSGQHCHASPQQ